MSYANGTFRARAVQGSATLGFTSGGKEQVGVQFQILEGEDTGKHITWYGFFTDKSTERTIESLRHMGWQGDDLSDLSTVGDRDAPDVLLVIEDELDDRDGTMRSRVRWVNRMGSGVAIKDKMDDAQARAFAARMKGAAVASRQKSATQRPATNRSSAQRGHEPPPHSDDDIPF